MVFLRKPFLTKKFPKLPPEKMAGEYIQSKMECKRIVKKLPEWDAPRTTPAVKLVEAQRDLDDVESRLAAKREQALKRRQHLDDQWKELEDKEELLRENFIKFNKFVKENQEKRERAERKIEEEKTVQEKRHNEIVNIEEKHNHMTQVKNMMEQRIKEYRMYEDYLQSVVEATTEFKGVDDILARYEALIDARKQLIERQERDLSALESARSDMMSLLEDKIFTVMGLNNYVANLFTRYENAKARALQWETTVAQIKSHTLQKLAELHQAKITCWDIYLQMCKRKKMEPTLKEGDVEHQLLYIKSTLMELAKIVRLTKRRTNRDISSSRAETPMSARHSKNK